MYDGTCLGGITDIYTFCPKWVESFFIFKN